MARPLRPQELCTGTLQISDSSGSSTEIRNYRNHNLVARGLDFQDFISFRILSELHFVVARGLDFQDFVNFSKHALFSGSSTGFSGFCQHVPGLYNTIYNELN